MFMARITAAFLFLASASSFSATLTITNSDGLPLPKVMVTQTIPATSAPDLSDQGYAPNGVTNRSEMTVTRFTDMAGNVSFDETEQAVRYRARAQGYVDAYFTELPESLTLTAMTPQQYISSFPSNVWLSQMPFDGDQELKQIFQLNCAFCHQQASPFMRNERTTEQWITVFDRMNTFGARLPEDDFERIANILQVEYRELRENPEVVPEPAKWEEHLHEVQYVEYVIGDGFSQMHDFLLHPNGMIYVGDNLHDRIYEVDPATGDYTVYKVPHTDDDKLGGILGNRFTTFPKMTNYYGVHSFSLSPKDGNIFITPSMRQALLEFNPRTKEFTIHEMEEGYYPHTIRSAEDDDVWFTLALSSQVARYNRTTKEFRIYDLPARNFKEWAILKSLPIIFSIDPKYRPTPSGDREGNGLPMPYGIDVAPNGSVWVARLYANDIAHIDPETHEVTMIDFPFEGPRRLRVDADNKVWIVAFQNSLLVKYDPETKEFTHWELPVLNELPYALNVDRHRNTVWVNGNQSDTIMSFDIPTETWKTYPMPRQRFFTRDVEVHEETGAVYTSNSHFPTWQSEGGMPTLLRIEPLAQTADEHTTGPVVDTTTETETEEASE